MKVKKFNKEVSLHTIYITLFMIGGIAMIVGSVCNYFKGNVVAEWIGFVVGFPVAVLAILANVFKKQKSDEMFRMNFNKAGRSAFLVLLIVIFMLWFISSIFEIISRSVLTWDLDSLGPLLIGVSLFSMGFFIQKYERGDA